MIDRIIEFSIRNRFLVVLTYALLAGLGYWALLTTPIDAIPDLSDNQVIVFSDWPGRSPQEVEDQITYPLTTSLQGLPDVRVVRSSSAFGFSMINVIFEDRVDLYFARTRVLERLNLVIKSLPAGVVPTLGPDATGVGHVFWYTVEGPLSLLELRSLQDWYVRYQLNSVSGVAEVASVGGQVQQYQINVDPVRLRAFKVPMSAVVAAVMSSNKNVGGNVLETSGAWSVVRGIGLIGSTKDLEEIAVAAPGGVPVRVQDVAEVRIGNAYRAAALIKNREEVVGGVIVARYGANTQQVIDAVKEKIAALAPGLPPGVTIVPFYDRSDLIQRSIATLRKALIEEIILVTIAHIVFLLHFRSILIVTIPLPLAVLISFLFMKQMDISSNIMSLAGIAIAIGVLVDAGIVVTENAFRFLEQRRVDPKDRPLVTATVLEATRLVGRPIFASMAIIILAFAPVFALTGQEGKLFRPLAFTKTFAMVGATLIAVTLVPVLCTYLLGGKFHREEDNPVMRLLVGIYRPVLRFALSHRKTTIAGAVVLFAIALWMIPQIGTEFMPPLNEGDLMFMPIADPGISLPQAIAIAKKQDDVIRSFPEVASAVAKIGRADTSTDPAPVNMTETIINLKPPEQWRAGVTRDSLISEMDQAIALPGVTNIWTQPIINRINMLTTGIRSEVGVKVFGGDLKVLEAKARQIAALVKQVSGAADVYPEQILGAPYLDIDIDRQAAARYGIGVEEVQDSIETAIGETVLSTTIEGRRRFAVRVRYALEHRNDIAALKQVLVDAPAGFQVPLGQLAAFRMVSGPSMISGENGLLVATVLLNVRGRDVGGFIAEAQSLIRDRLELPPGYYIGWSGQYENEIRARARLQLVVPIVVAIIFLVLYLTYGSFLEAAHVLLAVPFALTGGVFLLYFLGYNFSVAVWVGFIALFGTAVQTGVVMVIYLHEAVRRKAEALGRLDRKSLIEAIEEGALLRLRPKVMTVSTVIAGLLPIMWSTSTGAEVMKPLATPVLGGMVSSLLHVLVVTPVLFSWIHERQFRGQASGIRGQD